MAQFERLAIGQTDDLVNPIKAVLMRVKHRQRSDCKALGGPPGRPGTVAGGPGQVQRGSARRRPVAGGALAATLAGLNDWPAWMHHERLGPHAAMAVPVPDPSFPLLYALGVTQAVSAPGLPLKAPR